MTGGQARERNFNVDGLRLCAREWGEGGMPVLALHGWLDNAASFDELAPRLPGCHLLALDLPGHGHSDNKPAHATYNLWDDLLILLAVADAMGWQRFVVLGHSRGAMMSLMLSAALPERVAAMVCLDGLLPPPITVAETAAQLGKFLRDYRKPAKRPVAVFPSLDALVAARRRAMPMAEPAARRIAERAAQAVEGGYRWRSDPRLKAASAFKLTAEHGRALVEALQCPGLLVMAEQGLAAYTELRAAVLSFEQLETHILPGSHHFHMEAQAQAIADLILPFLRSKLGDNNNNAGVVA